MSLHEVSPSLPAIYTFPITWWLSLFIAQTLLLQVSKKSSSSGCNHLFSMLIVPHCSHNDGCFLARVNKHWQKSIHSTTVTLVVTSQTQLESMSMVSWRSIAQHENYPMCVCRRLYTEPAHAQVLAMCFRDLENLILDSPCLVLDNWISYSSQLPCRMFTSALSSQPLPYLCSPSLVR